MYTRTRYKECNPKDTVERIKTILSELEIQTDVQWYNNIGSDFSCRVRIINNHMKLFDIGTNGKGMTKEYALASAYAELMERLQNKSLFRDGLKYASKYCNSIIDKGFRDVLNNNDIELDFLYFPDELFSENNGICAPFINLNNGEKEVIPVGYYRAACGSTGMCAGNSKEEALCQGLNEIVERYILWKIFSENPQPNQLSIELFTSTEIYNKINTLKNLYEIRIHDWSLGEDYPVIGLLIIRKTDGAYTYRLGADFNIITALERCYTETLQGENAMSYLLKEQMHGVKSNYDDYLKCRHNGTGRFPMYLLSDFPQNNSFPHKDFKTYKEELQFWKTWLENKGYKTFVKDNSFLNFPAFTIYIPQISDVQIDSDRRKNIMDNKTSEFTYIESRYHLKDAIINTYKKSVFTNLKHTNLTIWLNPWNRNKDNQMYTHLAEAMIAIAKKEYAAAFHLIDTLIKGIESSQNISPKLLVQLKKCLYKCANNHSFNKDDIDNPLIVKIIDNPYAVINQLNIPECFDCKKCKISEDCHFVDIVALEKKIQNIQTQYYNGLVGK